MDEIKKVPYQTPIVSYGGRKGNMMKNIIGLINQYNITDDTFVDVFGGSGIVGLTVKYNCKFPTIIINDFDRRIFAVHKVGELGKFKEVEHIIDRKLTKYFYSAVNQGYYLKFYNMFKYRKASLPDVAAVSILRSIFNFRGKWKTDDSPKEGLYGQYPPIQPNIWKIPTLMKEMRSGKSDELYSGVKATNLDYNILCRKFEGRDTIFYLDPPYIDNTTVYRKGQGIMAIDSLELMVELDVPFIYSHDEVKVIVSIAEKHNLNIERYKNLSRAGTVKTEMLIHNLNRFYDRAKPNLLQWSVNNLDKINNKEDVVELVITND